MKQFYENLSYPSNVISNVVNRAKEKDRSTLLAYTPKESQSRIPLVITYNRSILPIVKQIQTNFSILQDDPDTSRLFPDLPLLAYRRGGNLKDILVHSTLQVSTPSDFVPGTFPCGHCRCKTCRYTSNRPILHGPKKKEIHVKQKFVCTKCHDIYISTSSY
jgi:hypothetical protein